MREKIHSIAAAFSALKEGREEGFDYFFKEYYTPLLWFGKKLSGDETIAEDIVSEAFVKLWKQREGLEHASTIKSYLYTTVRNGAVDVMRKKKLASTHEKEARYLNEIEEGNVFARMAETELYHQLYLAVKSLPPQAARVFHLFLAGRTYQEIADELRISIHTVRNQKVRAVELLRKRLPEHLLALIGFISFLF